MELRHKVVLLAVVPLVLAAGVLAFVVERQGTALVDHQVGDVERNWLDAKEAELRDLMALAQHEIHDLDTSGRDDQETRSQALRRLEHLNFGQDGYFFVYDLQGYCLMHPRQPELVGRDMWNFTDDTGRLVIQEIIAKAKQAPDGGFLPYRWQRPSQKQWRQKLGYLVLLPRWGWMLGTGIYLDDVETSVLHHVEATKHDILASSSAAIRRTMISIGVIAMLAVLVVGALGVALNISQQRLADANLRKLTWEVLSAQEAERARVSRYLHDEVVQDLIAVKCILETALFELESHSTPEKFADSLERGLTSLAAGIDQIRTISRDLRPPLQADGLPALLEQIGAEFSGRTGLKLIAEVPFIRKILSSDAATALLRVTQQALNNIERHARASQVVIQLAVCSRGGSTGVVLRVCDDGCGFNVTAVEARPGGGIGLLNMRERVEALGGRLSIRSGVKGTEIEAYLPIKGPREEDCHGDNADPV
ncbi:MAG TPA: cache domain-containing protein [Kofleriaceae bacterium]